MFYRRGKSAQALGMLEQALVDMQACRAKIRLAGSVWQIEPTLTQVTTNILQIMARTKVGQPRPHYPEGERHLLQKQLGLSYWSKGNDQYGYCGAEKSESVNLKQCSKCNTVCYCSRECQAEAWKSGHKEECKILRKGKTISQPEYDCLVAEIDKEGFAGVHGMVILMKDPETGEIFESLSDETWTNNGSGN